MPMHEELERTILDGIFNNGLDDIYVALYIGDPKGAGTEAVGAGYSRQIVTFGAASGGNPASSVSSSLVEFEVPPSENWGEVTHLALFKVSTLGTPLYSQAFTSVRPMDQGAKLSWAVGALTVTQN